MAEVVSDYSFSAKSKQSKKPPQVARMRVIYRILDAWGNKVVEEFDFKDREKAEERLAYLRYEEGRSSYYLQAVKVPME